MNRVAAFAANAPLMSVPKPVVLMYDDMCSDQASMLNGGGVPVGVPSFTSSVRISARFPTASPRR